MSAPKAAYTPQPFDRPVPKRFDWDERDNPEHTTTLRAEVDQVALLFQARFAHLHSQPMPDPNEPIPSPLWKRSYRIRNRYHSFDDTIEIQGLTGYLPLLQTASEASVCPCAPIEPQVSTEPAGSTPAA